MKILTKQKDKKMLMLSVLITTYNIEAYIDETIRSVINQDVNFNYEIIIGDDGSQDSTVERIECWRNKYPSLISYCIMERDPQKKYNPIERASQNRLNLLKKAKGRYITFLDGDDFYIDNKKFNKQISILEKAENQDCIMCTHNMNFYYEADGRVEPIHSGYLSDGKIAPNQYWGFLYLPAEAFIFRNVSLKGIFPPDYYKYYFDDNLIVYFYLKYGKIYYIKDIMANYRQNLTAYKSKSYLEQRIIGLMDYDIEKRYCKRLILNTINGEYSSMKAVYQSRNSLSLPEFNEYRAKAEQDRANMLMGWFNYGSCSVLRKSMMCMTYYLWSVIHLVFILWDIAKRIKGKIFKLFNYHRKER